jgi:NAD(P)-dependent dehydrogenase (short-subunit alcohol dehydrogenase family)
MTKNMTTSFVGKNFLVVGASSGIGYQIATQLLAQGATVYSLSRNTPANLAVHHITADATTLQGDIAGLPEVLHGLVYCVGSINLKPFARLSKEDFLKDYELNVLGAVNVLQGSLKSLKKSNEGASVVLFSTVAVGMGMGFHASIAAAKGAVEGLVRSLAAEFAPAIRVNAIAPSLTNTPLAKNLLATPEKIEAAARRHPLNKVGTPEEVAASAVFLLSDNARWITGQILHIDGGMSAVKTM